MSSQDSHDYVVSLTPTDNPVVFVPTFSPAAATAEDAAVTEWEQHGSQFRGMTANYDLGVEPYDHFTWHWWVKDSEFGDIVARGHAGDLNTAKQAAEHVGHLMEMDT